MGADGRPPEAASERLAVIVQRLIDEGSLGPESGTLAHEILTGLEQLRVADEELRARSQELAASTAAIVAERSRRLSAERELASLQLDFDMLTTAGRVTQFVAEQDPLLASLARLVAVAAEVMPGALVGTTVVGSNGEVRVAATSSSEALDLEEAQHADDDSPCRTALRTGEHQRTTAMAWKRTSAAGERVATTYGIAEIISTPMMVGPDAVGTLTFYMRADAAYSERAIVVIGLLADQAATAVMTARLFTEAAELAQNLTTALESRGTIEQAKGMIMARQGCDADEAFDILRRASQRENRRLRDIARDMVTRNPSAAGDEPDRPPTNPPQPN